jgi:hypothetical protein
MRIYPIQLRKLAYYLESNQPKYPRPRQRISALFSLYNPFAIFTAPLSAYHNPA